MVFVELVPALDALLGSLISPARAAHSRRVADLAASLCEREGLDPARGRLAGLAHDMCKDLPRRAQRELAAAYPGARAGLDEDSTLMSDKIVHGPAAAAMLARDFGVVDGELLEAVALHTVGEPGMGALAAILYCADKLDPGRERMDPEYRRGCLAMPLDAMLPRVVEGVIGWLREAGREVAPETLILYSTLVGGADPE